jgi:capsular polysaccharide biosynthesis protein
MQAVAPDLIKGILNTAEISVVDPSSFLKHPRGECMAQYYDRGIIGLLLSAATALLWEIMNNNVKSQEDLEKSMTCRF